MSVDGAFSGQPCLELNRVICEHLFRQGKMEVGETLMKVGEEDERMFSRGCLSPIFISGGRTGAGPVVSGAVHGAQPCSGGAAISQC